MYATAQRFLIDSMFFLFISASPDEVVSMVNFARELMYAFLSNYINTSGYSSPYETCSYVVLDQVLIVFCA